jgi:hypothetical protein
MLTILKKLRFFYLFWALFYIFLTLIALKYSLSYLDADFGWHLKVGQEIAQDSQIPRVNHFNYTFQGDWVDHEWLSNFLIYKIYSGPGYFCLSIVFALLIGAVLAALNWWIYKKNKRQPLLTLVVVLQVLGLLAALPSTGVRVQEIAWVFLFLLLIILDYYQRRPRFFVLLILMPFFYLWANLHASFLIGLFILFFWLGLKLLERLMII